MPPPNPASGLYPYLTIENAAAAIDFYKAVFDAHEGERHLATDGQRIMHTTLSFNGGTVMISDHFPEFGNSAAPQPDRPPPIAVSLALGAASEVDRIAALAAEHGATLEFAPMDAFWGARFASLRDPFGHRWMLSGPPREG